MTSTGNTQKDIRSKLLSSSNISQVDFDPFMGTLTVGFKNGTIYEYYGVEPEVFEELCEASSAGRFFNSKIKTKYDWSKRGKLQEHS